MLVIHITRQSRLQSCLCASAHQMLQTSCLTASKPEFCFKSTTATICGILCLTIHHKFNMVCRHVCICTCLCTLSRTRLYFGLLGFARVCDSILITAEQTVFVCPTLSNWYSCSLSQLRTDCWDFAQKSQNPGRFLP